MLNNYINEEFRSFERIDRGELNLDLSGNIIRIKYNYGDLSINKLNTIGKATLDIDDVVADHEMSDDTIFGIMGKVIVKVLEDKNHRHKIMESIKSNNITLYCSKTTDDKHIITIPVAFSVMESNIKDYEGIMIGKYSILEPRMEMVKPYSAQDVYAIHCKLAGKSTLVSDEKQMINETKQLVPRTLGVYKQYLEHLNKKYNK